MRDYAVYHETSPKNAATSGAQSRKRGSGPFEDVLLCACLGRGVFASEVSMGQKNKPVPAPQLKDGHESLSEL